MPWRRKFVWLSVFTLIETICPKVCSKSRLKCAKSPLSVDMRRSKTLLLRLPSEQKCNSMKWCYIFYSLNITPPLCEMYSGWLRVFSFCNIAAVISFYVCSISRNISRSQVAKSTSPGMLYEMKFNEDTFWGRALIREGLRIGTRALNWRHYLIFLIFLRDS